MEQYVHEHLHIVLCVAHANKASMQGTRCMIHILSLVKRYFTDPQLLTVMCQ